MRDCSHGLLDIDTDLGSGGVRGVGPKPCNARLSNALLAGMVRRGTGMAMRQNLFRDIPKFSIYFKL